MSRQCWQCGKELRGLDELETLCSACRHAEEVRRQGEEAREWRQRQEREDEERAREQREQAERQLELLEEQQAHQDGIRLEEIAYKNALPRCKWCGKQYSFAPESNSFYEYCSKKCATDDLGREKIGEYATVGLDLIRKQINNAFCDKNSIHKAIVLSEGYSQYFTVQQHISIANAIQEHRRGFLSAPELENRVCVLG